jgi:hypothetical protein
VWDRSRKLALGLALSAAAVLIAFVLFGLGREAGAPGAPADPVEAWLFRHGGGFVDQQLAHKDAIRAGDLVFLKLRLAAPRHVYVVNQDSAGNAYTLFPVSTSTLRNPLPGGAIQRLPPAPADGGAAESWRVDLGGGEENLVVIASNQPLLDLEQTLAQLPEPLSGERSRGMGTLARSPDTTALARILADLRDRAVAAEDVWIEEFVLSSQ